MKSAMGVDVGGTNLRVALVSENGEVIGKETLPVGPSKDRNTFFERLTGLVRKTAGSQLETLAGIGLGIPGICNPKEGVVHRLPHFPDWKDVPVAAILGKSFSCPIVFDNDANLAALGEHWKGAAQGLPSFIMLTLGTGIGGGLFLNGKVWRGDEGFAGEIGHMTVEVNGRPCVCGNRGCWETYAASQSVPEGTTAEELARKADHGEKTAVQFWNEFGRYFAIGIGNLAMITGVEHFFVGGAIVQAWRHFIGACQKELSWRTHARLAQKITLAPSTLKGEGGLLGAARLVFLTTK